MDSSVTASKHGLEEKEVPGVRLKRRGPFGDVVVPKAPGIYKSCSETSLMKSTNTEILYSRFSGGMHEPQSIDSASLPFFR